MKFKHINEITNYELQKELFITKSRIVLVYGGTGSGKSYSVVDKILIESLIAEQKKNKLKVLVIRKTLPSMKRSTIPLFEERASMFGIPISINGSNMQATLGTYTTVLFVSVNDKTAIEKIKSITDVDIIFIEEANEITYNAFQQIKMRLRGGKHDLKQLILVCNPVANSWLYDYFITSNKDNAELIQINYNKNKFLDTEYMKTVENLKNINKSLYEAFYLGNWSKPEGLIYTNVKTFDARKNLLHSAKATDASILLSFKELYISVDWGYTDPSVALFTGIRRDDHGVLSFYVIDEIYETGLTNIELIDKVKEKLKGHPSLRSIPIFCDSAEPDRIEEFRRNGLNSFPAEKSVLSGINSVLSSNVFIDEKCIKTLKDISLYSWMKDKNDSYTNAPAHEFSHAPDALRYGIHTYLMRHNNKPKIYVK